MADDAPDRAALLAEAYKRNLLPADQRGMYEEAIKRGLAVTIPGPGYVPEKAGQQFASGLRDPLEGAAQFLEHATPEPIRSMITTENNALARSTGLVAPIPAGGMDEFERNREAELRKTQGEPGGARALGQMASPMNLVPGAVVGRGVTTAGRVGRAVVSGAAGGAMQPVTDENFWTSKGMQTGAGAAGGAVASGLAEAGAKGINAVGEYLTRNFPENIDHHAVQAIMRRIENDGRSSGMTAQDAIDIVNSSPKPLTMVDVLGKETRGLAGNVARTPGPARSFVDQFLSVRDKAAPERLKGDVRELLHGGPGAIATTEALMRARSAAGNPAYEAMRRIENVWSPRLQRFMDDPVMKSGMARGYEIERLESTAANREFNPTQLGVDVDAEGNIKMLRKPNMRVLDMGKQGLDSMVAAERNPVTGKLSSRGVALERFREAYVAELDGLDTSGAYRAARAAWAGPSKAIDAVKLGRAVFAEGSSPEGNAALVAKLSDAEKEFYRIGVSDMLLEKIRRSGFGADEAKALVKSEWMQGQLRPAFQTQEQFDKFVESVTHERQMFEAGHKLLGGSQTAEREAEDVSHTNMLAAAGANIGKHLAGADTVFGAAKGLYGAGRELTKLYRDIGVQPNPQLNSRVAEILFTTDFKDKPELVKMLTTGIKGAPAPRVPTRPITDVLTGQNRLTRILTDPAATAIGGRAAEAISQ
jgi:hypothetical protein